MTLQRWHCVDAMDERTEIQGETCSQDLFSLTPKPMFFIGSHIPGKRMKLPTNWEACEDLIRVERVELDLKEQDVTSCKRIFQGLNGTKIQKHLRAHLMKARSDSRRGCRGGPKRAAARRAGPRGSTMLNGTGVML